MNDFAKLVSGFCPMSNTSAYGRILVCQKDDRAAIFTGTNFLCSLQPDKPQPLVSFSRDFHPHLAVMLTLDSGVLKHFTQSGLQWHVVTC